jgi:hypothetical protein
MYRKRPTPEAVNVPVPELLAAMALAASPSVTPPALRSIARVERDCVIVRDLRGRDRRECLHADGYVTYIGEFDSFAGGRVVGFSYTQNDLSGYRLIDRANSGEGSMVETGRKPFFSPDGHFFAVAVAQGYVEFFFRGIGLWSLGDNGASRLFFTDAAIDADWEIQSFPNDHCVLLATFQGSPTPTFYTLTFGTDISLGHTENAVCP